VRPAMVARVPVGPGNSDVCCEWSGPIEDALAHLSRHGVAVEAGPLTRGGAKGRGTSVYFRDPDGSLLEFISYSPAGDRSSPAASSVRSGEPGEISSSL